MYKYLLICRNPHSKKIDPHTETNKPYRQSIQSPAKKEFHF